MRNEAFQTFRPRVLFGIPFPPRWGYPSVVVHVTAGGDRSQGVQQITMHGPFPEIARLGMVEDTSIWAFCIDNGGVEQRIFHISIRNSEFLSLKPTRTFLAVPNGYPSRKPVVLSMMQSHSSDGIPKTSSHDVPEISRIQCLRDDL